MGKIYTGDVGTVIKLDTKEDISSSTDVRIIYEKPDGTSTEWIATINGSSYVQYITTSTSDLDQAGTWTVQVYVDLGSWVGHGESTHFKVYDLYN